MKYLIALLSLVLLLSSASAGGSRNCYKKVQTCCYRYRGCGVRHAGNKFYKPCPYKTCKKSCYPACHKVRVRRASRVKCYYKPCYNHCGHGHKVCKRVGGGSYYKKVCRRKCGRKCYTKHARCEYRRVTTYRRFCARASCGKSRTVGRRSKPKDYTKKSTHVERIKGRRHKARAHDYHY